MVILDFKWITLLSSYLMFQILNMWQQKKIESENEAYSIVENKYLFWYDQINCIFVIFIKQIIKNLKINFSVEIVKWNVNHSIQ